MPMADGKLMENKEAKHLPLWNYKTLYNKGETNKIESL